MRERRNGLPSWLQTGFSYSLSVKRNMCLLPPQKGVRGIAYLYAAWIDLSFDVACPAILWWYLGYSYDL